MKDACLQSKFRPVRISKKSEPLTSIHIHPLQTICTSKSCFQGCTHWSISVQLCFLSQENKNANAKVDEVLFLRSTVIDQSLKPFLRSHQHVVHWTGSYPGLATLLPLPHPWNKWANRLTWHHKSRVHSSTSRRMSVDILKWHHMRPYVTNLNRTFTAESDFLLCCGLLLVNWWGFQCVSQSHWCLLWSNV